MGKVKSMFRRKGPSKEVIQANKNKIEANKIDRVVTFVIKNCVECPSLNKVRLQSEQFLIQCMKDDVTTFKVSSPELLKQMFEKCLYWPKQVEKKNTLTEGDMKTEIKNLGGDKRPIQPHPNPI